MSARLSYRTRRRLKKVEKRVLWSCSPFGMYRSAARFDIETENRPAVGGAVFTASILPRWFSSQWFADALVAQTSFYFL
jgi:hypothetical protein